MSSTDPDRPFEPIVDLPNDPMTARALRRGADTTDTFVEVPQRVETAMISATQASGWSQAGVSHGLNLRKGSFHLKGGCGVDGCYYILDTGPRLTQNLAVVPEGYTLRVEELESHLDPAAPAPTRR